MYEGQTVKLLDHGYLMFIEHWGSDKRIVEAARMSTDKGFEGWGPIECPNCFGTSVVREMLSGSDTADVKCPKCKAGTVQGDEKLLKYLWDNEHATPFEMGGMVVEVQAPIFVFREWHR